MGSKESVSTRPTAPIAWVCNRPSIGKSAPRPWRDATTPTPAVREPSPAARSIERREICHFVNIF